jgi:hypothetical protein
MANLLLNMPINYEPKKQNRFIFSFPSNMGIQSWFVVSSKRPNITIDPIEIPFLNTSTWVSGRFKWEAIDVTLRDPNGPSASQAIMEWVRLHAESVTGRMGYAAGYKKNVTLEMLDPTGVVIERWKLVNTMMTSADFGTLDYSSGDLADITINLQMDRCILVF